MERRRILITGASGGIGKAIALYLADCTNTTNNNYELVLHYNRNKTSVEQLENLLKDKGVNAYSLSFDISNRDQTQKTIQEDIENKGVYYGVICNAGINSDNPFPILSGDQWDKVIHTNLDGVYNVIYPTIMPMVSSRSPGRIITISSISGVVGNRGQVNYSASKAGIIGFTKALALEMASHKITVNCIAPGLIDTDMLKDLDKTEIKKIIPMRRIGTGKEVASLVAYLLSDDAGYITRQVISINGGMI